MKRVTAPKNKHQVEQAGIHQLHVQHSDQSTKRIVGKIRSINTGSGNSLACSVLVADGKNGHLFAGGVSVLIIDDPLDILQRYGEIRPGMRVEVFYSGTTETRQAQARIIGPPVEWSEGLKQENTEVNSAPVLPFEPMGF